VEIHIIPISAEVHTRHARARAYTGGSHTSLGTRDASQQALACALDDLSRVCVSTRVRANARTPRSEFRKYGGKGAKGGTITAPRFRATTRRLHPFGLRYPPGAVYQTNWQYTPLVLRIAPRVPLPSVPRRSPRTLFYTRVPSSFRPPPVEAVSRVLAAKGEETERIDCFIASGVAG